MYFCHTVTTEYRLYTLWEVCIEHGGWLTIHLSFYITRCSGDHTHIFLFRSHSTAAFHQQYNAINKSTNTILHGSIEANIQLILNLQQVNLQQSIIANTFMSFFCIFWFITANMLCLKILIFTMVNQVLFCIKSGLGPVNCIELLIRSWSCMLSLIADYLVSVLILLLKLPNCLTSLA